MTASNSKVTEVSSKMKNTSINSNSNSNIRKNKGSTETSRQSSRQTGTSNSSSANSSTTTSRRQPPQRRRLSASQQSLQDYVPNYLQPFLNPYHGEYLYTPIFQPHFIAQLMAEGFLPVATSGMLLPKLHLERSTIQLRPQCDLHVSKSARKKSKRFTLTVNQEFDKVIQACHDQHGSHCWLYPPLVQAFRDIFSQGMVEATTMDSTTGRPTNPRRVWKVRLYTIEVWNVESGELAGGEIGYTVGSIYTSLTGFTRQDSAGSVQLAALGRILTERGFHLWDLGMMMDYKRDIGAKAMPRDVFVREVHRVRETEGHLTLPVRQQARNCKDIIDQIAPPVSQQQAKSKNSASKSAAKIEKIATNSDISDAAANATNNVSNHSNSSKASAHSPPVSGGMGMPMKKKKVRESGSEDLPEE